MRKTRVHFEKIGNIKGAFPARMGMIKVKNGKNLTEVEEIKGGKIHRRTFFFFLIAFRLLPPGSYMYIFKLRYSCYTIF